MSRRNRVEIIPGSVFMVSLGCPKNLVDSEVMAGILATSGYQLSLDEDCAAIYLVNTCAFLPAAREEAESVIREAVAWKKQHSGRRIVVTGCLPEKDRSGVIRAKYPEVDQWLRVDAIPELGKLLRSGESPEFDREPTFLYDHMLPRLLFTLPHVAYLKIADGCDNHCSYCSIPGIRGSLRSRPLASLLTEAEQLIAGGVRELVVIAQDITAYGCDRPQDGEKIEDLIRALNKLPGDFIIRLLYAHPAHCTPEFIRAMGECGKVVPYLDLPLQHISDRILKAMGRKVTRRETEKVLSELRRQLPGIALRTTFITGFPGETEAEFQELREFLAEQKFERCGVFPFSPEPDTPAALLAGQLDSSLAEERAAELMELQSGIMLAYHRSLLGKRFRVLIDRTNGRQAWGRGSFDAPDIDNEVVISGAARLKVGRFCDIIIDRAETYEVYGKPVNK